MNGLGQAGAECMGKALKNNRTLIQLDVNFNRINERGAGFIAVGLQTNDVLQGLKVRQSATFQNQRSGIKAANT